MEVGSDFIEGSGSLTQKPLRIWISGCYIWDSVQDLWSQLIFILESEFLELVFP